MQLLFGFIFFRNGFYIFYFHLQDSFNGLKHGDRKGFGRYMQGPHQAIWILQENLQSEK
jgi:hypothetical protein